MTAEISLGILPAPGDFLVDGPRAEQVHGWILKPCLNHDQTFPILQRSLFLPHNAVSSLLTVCLENGGLRRAAGNRQQGTNS